MKKSLLSLFTFLLSFPLLTAQNCNTVDNLAVFIRNSTSGMATWEGANGASEYLIHYLNLNTQKLTQEVVNKTEIDPEEFLPNSDYQLWVTTLCGNNSSLDSERVFFTTPPLPCTPPQWEQLGVYEETLTLTLATIADAITYQVLYRPVGGNNTWVTLEKDDPNFFILGLTPDSDYLIKARANCPGGWSDYTSNLAIRTDGPNNPGAAAELESAEILTKDYILLHFDEGEVIFHQIGQEGQNDVLLKTPLDLSKATTLNTYSISSTTDSYYQTSRIPIDIARKSKGDDFSQIWYEYPYASDHWLYLQLPQAMKGGHSYTISLGGLAHNTNEVNLSFDVFQHRSEAIHVNQIGFVPSANLKYGYVSAWLGDRDGLNLDSYEDASFYLVDQSDGQIAFSGQLKQRYDYETAPPENYNGTENAVGYYATDVWECDFSSFQTPGEYRLVVEGIGRSFPFEVGDDVYRETFKTVTRALYHHRSGIERTSNYTQWVKPISHRPGVNGFTVEYSDWRYMDGTEAFSELVNNATGIMMPDAWGGWMDAADFDRNANHLKINNQLLLLYELAPEKFEDGELQLPESGNGIPDIIDEARWGVELFRRLKGPTGGICGGIEAEEHPAAGQASWTDTLRWYTYAEEPKASYTFAASAVQLAHNLELVNVDTLSVDLLTEAIAAYEWANNNLQPGDDPLVRDERAFAAAWLYKFTGDLAYETQFLQDLKVLSNTDPLISYDGANSYDQEYAVWTYLTTDRPDMNQQVKQRLEEASINWANTEFADPAALRACRMGFGMWAPTVVGISATTPQVMPAIVAYEISGQAHFLDYIHTTCDYYLGGNALNMTWVTGLGDRHPMEILHIDSWFDGIEPYVPGIVPYGIQSPAFDYDFSGVHATGYIKTSAYPTDVYQWPTHELYFNTRYTPLTSEYTVWQNIAPAAVAYGYLSAEIPGPNTRTKDQTSGKAELTISPLKIFPNPAQNQLTVDLQQVAAIRMEIIDASGRTIQQVVFKNQLEQIDISRLVRGLYTLQVWTESGQRLTQRFLKME